MTEEYESFDALRARLEADGWQRGLPRQRGLIDGAAIDARVAQQATCDHCGHTGLEFVPFTDPERRISQTGYTAVAHCSACGHSFEF